MWVWPPIILHEHEFKTRQNIGLLPRWCDSKFNLLYTAIHTRAYQLATKAFQDHRLAHPEDVCEYNHIDV
jgi:hypothetical protein